MRTGHADPPRDQGHPNDACARQARGVGSGWGQAAPPAWSEVGVETLSLSLGFWLPVVLTAGRDHSIVFSFLLPLRS